MRTYFKNINFMTYIGLITTIGLTTVSCTSLNSNYYDVDGIYNTGKIKAPVTHNETAYYEEYFNDQKDVSYETFTDVDNYSSYSNGSYPGWGESNSNTNIYINSGFGNSYWGWNNYYPTYGWNYGFGFNNYWGWNYGFGFGGYYGWGNPYFGGGWGYPYYGNGWGYPYYGYNTRNISRTSNTRTIASTNRGSNSIINSTRNNTNLNRSSRVAIENSRVTANRLDARNNTRVESTNIRNSNTRPINSIQNNRTPSINNSTPTRNSNFNSTPSRMSSPDPRMGGSSSGGRMSSGRR